MAVDKVLKEDNEIFERLPIAVDNEENPRLRAAHDISAAWISFTYNCETNVLNAFNEEIVAEEITALSTVTPVISCVIAVETIFAKRTFTDKFSISAYLKCPLSTVTVVAEILFVSILFVDIVERFALKEDTFTATIS